MDIRVAHRKVFKVEYVKVTEENISQVAEWVGSTVGGTGQDRFVSIPDKTAVNSRQKKAFIGDVVTHYKETGSFKSFSNTAFDNAFDKEVDDRVIHRDAGDGQFISAADAEADPEGTVSETVHSHDAGLGEK